MTGPRNKHKDRLSFGKAEKNKKARSGCVMGETDLKEGKKKRVSLVGRTGGGN